MSKTVKRILLGLWLLFVAGILIVYLIFNGLSKGWIGNTPSVEDLENPIDKFATQIISSDGVVLGTFARSEDNRVWVDFEELSPYIVKALVATEDVRFQEHSGIDLKALVRAIVSSCSSAAPVAAVRLPSSLQSSFIPSMSPAVPYRERCRNLQSG